MFLLFAQWFTDSFLHTDRNDWRKNTSRGDRLLQIYGLSEAKTRMLRSMEGGRLKRSSSTGRSTRRSCSSGRPAARTP